MPGRGKPVQNHSSSFPNNICKLHDIWESGDQKHINSELVKKRLTRCYLFSHIQIKGTNNFHRLAFLKLQT